MKGRLGVYDKKPFNPNTNSVEGVEHQSVRLRQMGGNRQQERMIKDKRRRFSESGAYESNWSSLMENSALD